MNTKADGPPLLRQRHGRKPPPGARASRPHKSWHSLCRLHHPGRPATAPGLCFGRVRAVPTGRVAGCRNAGKLSGTQRECMRAGRPRSRVAPPPITPAPQGNAHRLAGPQSCRCGRAVTLGGLSWTPLFPFLHNPQWFQVSPLNRARIRLIGWTLPPGRTCRRWSRWAARGSGSSPRPGRAPAVAAPPRVSGTDPPGAPPAGLRLQRPWPGP